MKQPKRKLLEWNCKPEKSFIFSSRKLNKIVGRKSLPHAKLTQEFHSNGCIEVVLVQKLNEIGRIILVFNCTSTCSRWTKCSEWHKSYLKEATLLHSIYNWISSILPKYSHLQRARYHSFIVYIYTSMCSLCKFYISVWLETSLQ